MNGAQNIEWLPVESLIPYARNARQHPESQISGIAGSIKEFGFNAPVLMDGQGGIIAGHGRVLAAQRLGMTTVPCVRLAHLTETQKRAYILADNRLAEQATWDTDLLALELDDLKLADVDLSLTGFDDAAIDALMRDLALPQDAEDEGGFNAESPVPETPITQPGDLWLLDRHRVYCGSCLEDADLIALIGDAAVTFVFADAPYGINIVRAGGVSHGDHSLKTLKGSVGGDKQFGAVSTGLSPGPGLRGAGNQKGRKIKANIYPPIAGDDNGDVARAAYRLLSERFPGAGVRHVWWGANHYSDVFPPSPCWIIWDKDNGDSFFADGELAYCNDKTAVRIFKHRWNGLLKDSERDERRVHPTQKPIALASWCFENYGKADDVIFEPFLGSGPGLLAAEFLDRRCFGMELSPGYCDIAIRRWQTKTQKSAIHAVTGELFPGVES